MLCAPMVAEEILERPPGFIAPNLSPVGLTLTPRELADGVYALMADQIPKDNNGLIVGNDAALVVDAGITPGIGREIQRLAAGLTDRPIRHLANTTYHGDHTFGNAAFGPEVTVYTSRRNKAAMTDLAAAKSARMESMYGETTLDDVTTWRRADVVFDRFCEIDLGGRVVHLWHFGSGNGSGDTIVHVPDAKVAWTGNFAGVSGGSVPMCLVGDPTSYITSLRTMRATLELDTLVPGHSILGPAEPSLTDLIGYLESLATEVTARHDAGDPVDTLYDTLPIWGMELPPGLPEPVRALLRSLHQLNILTTYRWLDGAVTHVTG